MIHYIDDLDWECCAVIVWINLNKTATQAFSQFPVTFKCLEIYTKNSVSSNLRKLVFWTECWGYVIWVIWSKIFYLEEQGQKCPVRNFWTVCITAMKLYTFWNQKDTNNSFFKWRINFADVSKNYVYCKNTLIFSCSLVFFNCSALNDNRTTSIQIIIQGLQICNWGWYFTIFNVLCWCQLIFDFRKKTTSR